MLSSAIEDLALGLAGDALLVQKTAVSSVNGTIVHSTVSAMQLLVTDMKLLAKNKPELLEKFAKRIRVYVLFFFSFSLVVAKDFFFFFFARLRVKRGICRRIRLPC
jgi:hypothetical protein